MKYSLSWQVDYRSERLIVISYVAEKMEMNFEILCRNPTRNDSIVLKEISNIQKHLFTNPNQKPVKLVLLYLANMYTKALFKWRQQKYF